MASVILVFVLNWQDCGCTCIQIRKGVSALCDCNLNLICLNLMLLDNIIVQLCSHLFWFRYISEENTGSHACFSTNPYNQNFEATDAKNYYL
jgi:hypothetical protein